MHSIALPDQQVAMLPQQLGVTCICYVAGNKDAAQMPMQEQTS